MSFISNMIGRLFGRGVNKLEVAPEQGKAELKPVTNGKKARAQRKGKATKKGHGRGSQGIAYDTLVKRTRIKAKFTGVFARVLLPYRAEARMNAALRRARQA